MIVYTGSHYHCHCHSIVQIDCRYCYYFCSRVGAESRDAVIDVLIKVIPKNKLAVELFVKLGGELLWAFNLSLPCQKSKFMIKIPKLLFCLMLECKYYQVKVLAKRFNLNVHTTDSNIDSNFRTSH